MEATRAASSLPRQLKDFFARYPPVLFSAKFTGIKLPLTRRDAKEAAVLRHAQISKDAQQASLFGQPILVPSQTLSSPLSGSPAQPTVEGESSNLAPTQLQDAEQNRFPPSPFLPKKNHRTGRWAGPKIGLRRQAALVKLARAHNIEELLPPSIKSTVFKEERLLERGLRIKGTGEGQKVKGHKWERRIDATLDKRRKAMENMPQMIREWKQKGHGRGWAKYPSSKASKN